MIGKKYCYQIRVRYKTSSSSFRIKVNQIFWYDCHVFHSPLSKVFVVHSVGKSFSADSNPLKDSVTSQLMHDQMGINYTYVRQKKKKQKKRKSRRSSRVNFTNILCAAFSYESFVQSFFVLAVKVKLVIGARILAQMRL